jgi:N utilization substance protein B
MLVPAVAAMEKKKTTKSQDKRHLRRRKAIKELFAYSFNQVAGRKKTIAKSSPLVREVISKVKEIDNLIKESASKWPIDKINKIDLAILRLAIWEMVFYRRTPYKVVIDEAVELAKEYGSEKSPGFVNGVLGTVYEKTKQTKPNTG